jgi:hypothetical protein
VTDRIKRSLHQVIVMGKHKNLYAAKLVDRVLMNAGSRVLGCRVKKLLLAFSAQICNDIDQKRAEMKNKMKQTCSHMKLK